jgi:hypothetical protein
MRILVRGVTALFAVSLITSWILLGRIDTQRRELEKELFQLRLEVEPELALTRVNRTDYINTSYFETNVRQLIRVQSTEGVKKTRRNLVYFLWGQEQLPTAIAKVVVNGHKDKRFSKVQNLSRIDMLSVDMEFNLISTIYHFIPENGNGNVILYHQGHNGDFRLGYEAIGEFLRMGYSVLGLSMPLIGMNNRPDVHLDRFGLLRLGRHDHMKFLTPEKGHPLQYFVEPVVQTINYLEENYDYSVISMTGISGGGWTTTISAAIDPRIAASFPVAGTIPVYLRSKAADDWGDWEQTVPEFYEIANYLELYVLGSSGFGRKQWQILNLYDDCCFSGFKSQTYRWIVSSVVEEIDLGQYELFIDSSHTSHKISKRATEVINNEIQRLSN